MVVMFAANIFEICYRFVDSIEADEACEVLGSPVKGCGGL